MSSKQQTAVQKLANKLSVTDRARYNGEIEQALEEEKENLIDAFDCGDIGRGYNEGEQYYNETYGNEQQ
jgi:hypothetical protein